MRRFLLFVLPALLLIGCGDLSRSTGELGRVNYSLHSDFVVDGSGLVDVSILAGHPQRIDLDLTDAGEQATDDPSGMSHTVTPSGGVTLEEQEGEFGFFTITVTDPGAYVIESRLDGDLFDRITLTFDVPSALDVVTWVRAPNADDFTSPNGTPIQVAEGSQAAFVPIPMDAAGDRLAGDFVPTLDADPEWAVVRGLSILGIYEQNVVVARSPSSVYFIEPGPVALTLRDTVNDVGVDVFFDVAPVELPPAR